MTRDQIKKYDKLIDFGVDETFLDKCLDIRGNFDDTLQKIYEYELRDNGIEIMEFEEDY